jgi:sugar O-acyltransferase (sialic acid O-acetyltransferase NeuD family)
MMGRIAVVGASDLAKVVIDLVEKAGVYEIAGLVDERRQVGESFYGCRVLGRDADIAAIAKQHSLGALAIAIGDNWRRHLVAERLGGLAPRLEFPALVHPSAVLARGASLGAGAIAGPGAVVGGDARVGRFAYLAFHASVGENGRVGDFATLGSSAAMAGSAALGAFSVLAIGAAVIHGVSIGEHSVVGAGATVVRDLPDHVVAVGTPAAVLRERQTGDAYL